MARAGDNRLESLVDEASEGLNSVISEVVSTRLGVDKFLAHSLVGAEASSDEPLTMCWGDVSRVGDRLHGEADSVCAGRGWGFDKGGSGRGGLRLVVWLKGGRASN